MKRYNPKEIEPRWQKKWAEDKVYEASDSADKPKKYILEFFPYPSGAAMHVGHVRNYTIGDAISRYSRMRGYNVLHPMGWDAFGLPAENYAIKTGISPQKAVADNVERFKQQLTQMGFGYDWSREINSTDPDYYKWTQWLFLLLHKRGLAYQKEALVNWDPIDKTVLANEQIIDGRADRSGAVVEKKALKQWFFKITEYADRLAKDLDDINWSDSIKTMQRNWIGRSKGAEIDFAVDGSNEKIKVFTTRPDTIFGATFMVLAPEHPLVEKITTDKQRDEVNSYVKQAQAKSDVERQETERQKTGVPTGAYATNPANGEKIPIWVADYVLYGYGTGAIMAVPAHDERDWEFAKQFDLPIREVVAPEFGEKRDNEEWADGSTVMVYDETTDRYLGLAWDSGWTGLVGGGLHDGEDYETCARRELAEEASIHEAKAFEPLGGPVFAHYAHPVKNLNRVAKTQAFIAIVSDRQGEGAQKEDHEKFANKWFTKDELVKNIRQREGTDHWLELIRRADGYVAAHKAGKKVESLAPTVVLEGEGITVNSGKYDGMPASEARDKIVADLEEQGAAKERVNYKIRDWLISRQRYWGAPIPMIHCQKCGTVPVPEDQLPVVLPEMESYEPSGDGRSPLARVDEWVNVECPKCDGPAQRETDTMDGFACSSWYFLRFTDPHNDQSAFDAEKAKHWLPVDDYIGGAEHAVMHLLYARFWTKVMYDEGLINFQEPFTTLRNQGMILAPDGQKMSKSKGNTIEPDSLIKQGYGADAIRIMELFIGPWNQSANWSVEGMGGSFRFLQRVWTLTQDVVAAEEGEDKADTAEIKRVTHRAIKKTTEDLESLSFNTAVAAMMEAVNGLYAEKTKTPFDQAPKTWRWAAENLLQLLAPFAPHIAEELWEQTGHSGSIHTSDWPRYDEKYLVSDTMTIVVQINGKVRAQLEVASDASQESIVKQAKADDKVAGYLNGSEPKKTVYVPNKLVSFVV